MKKFSPVLLLLALLLTGAASLTGCGSDTIYEQQAKLIEAQKKTDDATIQAYLTRNNISSSQYTRLPSGIYLVTVTDGPTTNPLIKVGQKVTTNYVGKFLDAANDGIVFDSSSDNRTPCGCFTFYNGGSGIIGGWNMATLQMREGDRKLVLIPTYLASCVNCLPVTPANAPVLFDVEILNVE